MKSIMKVRIMITFSFISIVMVSCRQKKPIAQRASTGLHQIELKDSKITSAKLKTCPFGHSALKDIPIVYGLGAGTQSIDGNETWPGGCIVGSETNKVVCTQCRYAYDPLSKTWDKNVGGTSELLLPVAAFVADFPAPKGKAGFCQSVRGTKAITDELSYWDSTSLVDIDKTVQVYTKKSGRLFERDERDLGERHTIRYKSKFDSNYHFIRLRYHHGQRSTYVTVTRSAEKPYEYDVAYLQERK